MTTFHLGPRKKHNLEVESLLNGNFRAIFTFQSFELFFSISFKSEPLYFLKPHFDHWIVKRRFLRRGLAKRPGSIILHVRVRAE